MPSVHYGESGNYSRIPISDIVLMHMIIAFGVSILSVAPLQHLGTAASMAGSSAAATVPSLSSATSSAQTTIRVSVRKKFEVKEHTRGQLCIAGNGSMPAAVSVSVHNHLDETVIGGCENPALGSAVKVAPPSESRRVIIIRPE